MIRMKPEKIVQMVRCSKCNKYVSERNICYSITYDTYIPREKICNACDPSLKETGVKFRYDWGGPVIKNASIINWNITS